MAREVRFFFPPEVSSCDLGSDRGVGRDMEVVVVVSAVRAELVLVRLPSRFYLWSLMVAGRGGVCIHGDGAGVMAGWLARVWALHFGSLVVGWRSALAVLFPKFVCVCVCLVGGVVQCMYDLSSGFRFRSDRNELLLEKFGF